MIALTTKQLDVLLAAAARVPHQWRHRFLDDVADQLLTGQLAGQPTEDATVAEAVQSTLRRIGLTQKEPTCPDD